MKKMVLIFSLCLVVYAPVTACTTAVISGKVTPDGRPLLFKHRDSGTLENVMIYDDSGRYAFIGLINAGDSSQVWAGSNSAGFAIMNSASYNLNADTSSFRDGEGVLMRRALMTCATLADFEQLLQEMPRPLPVEANFGVIDARGGATYYETSNAGFVKINVNDPAVAPEGYIIRTNYSATGTPGDGQGYIRYAAAETLFYRAAAMGDLTPRFLLQQVSRCLRHGLTETDLSCLDVPADRPFFVPFQDYIVRYSSSATVAVQGVLANENPVYTTIWTIPGWQPACAAVPLWVAGGEDIPTVVAAGDSGAAPLCSAALKFKGRAFPVTRGHGTSYLNLSAVINEEGTGMMQVLRPLEDEVMAETKERLEKWREEGMKKKWIEDYYHWLDSTVFEAYARLGRPLR